MNKGKSVVPPVICCQRSIKTSAEDSTGRNLDNGQRNTETPSPSILWNNYSLEKNSTSDSEIEPGTS